MPGFTSPTCPASPTARAPPMVAASIASQASTPDGSPSMPCASSAYIFIAWNRFWQSLQLQLSQPSARLMPARLKSISGATPFFSLRLASGLCTTPAPAAASWSISSRVR